VLSFVGLFVIAVGTGGIKSCVSAFGGDQFETDQVSSVEHDESVQQFSCFSYLKIT